ARIEQVKSKLEAEVVAPARAQSEADLAKARGDAAKIVENGKAQATALAELARQWKKMGSAAREIFLMQKLDVILPIYLSSIRQIKVDKITMLQPGAQGAPGQLVGSLETLRASGIDVARAFQKWSGVVAAEPVYEEPAPAPVPVAPAPSTEMGPVSVAPVPPPMNVSAPLEPAPRPVTGTPIARKIQKGQQGR